MDLINNFLKDLEKRDKSELTIISYKYNLNQLCDIMSLNDSDLKTFSTQMFYEYTDVLRQMGYSISSINQKIGCLASFYRYLYKHRIINDERHDSFGKIVTERKLPQFLEKDDTERLLNKVRELDFSPTLQGTRNIRDRLIIEILLNTGVRVFELQKMKISDINFETGDTYVLGKNKRQRIVKLSASTLSIIKEMLELRKLITVDERYENCLFISRNGNDLGKRQMQNIVKKYIEESEIEQVSLHKLRHTYASMCLSEGILTLKQIQDRLGHKSIETTELYVHAMKSEQGDLSLFA